VVPHDRQQLRLVLAVPCAGGAPCRGSCALKHMPEESGCEEICSNEIGKKDCEEGVTVKTAVKKKIKK
jgi:hypothetical protein